ncbi:hypothetical protein BCR34DRAFT_668646 [Clohesyomyces aquaticus]|uniref:Uncharacterized protein n=1 Tax=Clohesyomyces aquaticus TaxID=1231657 RepID=A0A1Y1YL54_9PLEO|nr:hypothetical protein BCR34DRAFT_668646 [Clohesyomyces aquaticus]
MTLNAQLDNFPAIPASGPADEKWDDRNPNGHPVFSALLDHVVWGLPPSLYIHVVGFIIGGTSRPNTRYHVIYLDPNIGTITWRPEITVRLPDYHREEGWIKSFNMPAARQTILATNLQDKWSNVQLSWPWALPRTMFLRCVVSGGFASALEQRTHGFCMKC